MLARKLKLNRKRFSQGINALAFFANLFDFFSNFYLHIITKKLIYEYKYGRGVLW